jgi:predicted dehydrogenase
MGRWHAHAARRAGAIVVAVIDPDTSKATRLASRYPNCRAGSDLAAAIDGVDAVHVCTPSSTHTSITRQALTAGRHVLVEKPLAPDAAQTAALLGIAESRGVLLCPVHQFLFQRGVRRAFARAGMIGPLRHVDVTICSAGAESEDGAGRHRVAGEIMAHPLALIERLLPGRTAAGTWMVRSPKPGELRALGELGDVTVAVMVSTAGRPTVNLMTLVGERGTIHVDLFHGFATVRRGAVSRARKAWQPFGDSLAISAAAGFNLMIRALTGEPAYPGLRTLIARFYLATTGQGPVPIGPAETLAVASALERLTAVRGRGGD